MLAMKWLVRVVRDVIVFGVVNDSYAISMIVLFFLFLGLLIIGAQASAPFIYTLF